MSGVEIANQGQIVYCRPPFAAYQSLVSPSTSSAEVPQLQGEESKPKNKTSQSQKPLIKLIWPVYHPAPDGPPSYLDPAELAEIRMFIRRDLSLERFERIRNLLWFAGNVGGRAMSLTECIEYNRSIKLTGRADMHVVTHFRTIYLKPLPDYLLCHEVWIEHICKDLRTYQHANTLLCSYTTILILSESDLRIAHSHGLIHENISWEQWTTIARAVSRHRGSRVVSIRWIYGELRLARLNWIYRCTQFCIYHKQDSRGWLIGTLVYITIVLTAMQVGLGTDKLQNSPAFQRASYGFTVFSIMAPVIVLGSRWALTIFGAIKRRASSKIASDRFQKGLRRQLGDPTS